MTTPDLPVSVFHLISAHDVVPRGRLTPTYVALCSELVETPGFSERTECPNECECEFTGTMAYCPDCLSTALEQNRQAGVEGECPPGMSGAETRLVGDFVTASRLLAAGNAESALRVLLPSREGLERRVSAMVTVGALVSGTLAALAHAGPGPESVSAPPDPKLAVHASAGARRDGREIRDLIAARYGEGGWVDEALVDALVELMIGFAALERAR